jgi:hypothetical protein
MLTEKKISESLDIWIKEANSLLVEVSQLILEFREYLQNSAVNNSNSDLSLINKVKLKKDYFSFFNLDEKTIDKEIFSIYGIDI